MATPEAVMAQAGEPTWEIAHPYGCDYEAANIVSRMCSL